MAKLPVMSGYKTRPARAITTRAEAPRDEGDVITPADGTNVVITGSEEKIGGGARQCSTDTHHWRHEDVPGGQVGRRPVAEVLGGRDSGPTMMHVMGLTGGV